MDRGLAEERFEPAKTGQSQIRRVLEATAGGSRFHSRGPEPQFFPTGRDARSTYPMPDQQPLRRCFPSGTGVPARCIRPQFFPTGRDARSIYPIPVPLEDPLFRRKSFWRNATLPCSNRTAPSILFHLLRTDRKWINSCRIVVVLRCT